MRKETIRFCRLDQGGADLPLPSYQSNSAAGMDICAGVAGETVVRPGERVLIPTGLAVALPEGFEIQVRPRSGLAVQYGVTVLNSPGTIDADYRGEIKILLINLGTENFVVRRSDRIAQLIVAPVVRVDIELVDQLDITERGSGGFGHTGV